MEEIKLEINNLNPKKAKDPDKISQNCKTCSKYIIDLHLTNIIENSFSAEAKIVTTQLINKTRDLNKIKNSRTAVLA